MKNNFSHVSELPFPNTKSTTLAKITLDNLANAQKLKSGDATVGLLHSYVQHCRF